MRKIKLLLLLFSSILIPFSLLAQDDSEDELSEEEKLEILFYENFGNGKNLKIVFLDDLPPLFLNKAQQFFKIPSSTGGSTRWFGYRENVLVLYLEGTDEEGNIIYTPAYQVPLAGLNKRNFMLLTRNPKNSTEFQPIVFDISSNKPGTAFLFNAAPVDMFYQIDDAAYKLSPGESLRHEIDFKGYKKYGLPLQAAYRTKPSTGNRQRYRKVFNSRYSAYPSSSIFLLTYAKGKTVVVEEGDESYARSGIYAFLYRHKD